MTKQIRWVDPTTITTAAFNPKHRTDDRQLKDLIASMEKDGFHEFQPLLISTEGILGDGHRRLAASLKLGLKRVSIFETDMPLVELYNLNVSHLSHKPRDWAEAYFRGLTSVPPRIAVLIGRIEEIVGRDGVRLLVEYGMSPDVYSVARKVATYCGNPSNEFVGKILYWIVEHHQVTVVKLAMRSKTNAAWIANHIVENVPLMQINTEGLMPTIKPRAGRKGSKK